MVCEQERDWRKRGLQVPRVSVNTSASQLRNPSFAPMVTNIFEETEASADRIELELAATATLATDDTTDDTLRALRALGIRLVLDDFGMGHSSLRILRRYEFSRVKIDRGLVRELPFSHDDSVLTRGIVGMAHGLGLAVTAVGVETEGQAQFLREQSCDELQGFLFGGSLRPNDFEQLLERDKPSK